MNREVNPVVAVLIIVALAAVAAGVYFIAQRPRTSYDPKKASEAAARRGAEAFRSMSGASGGQVPSGGMPYSGGFQRGPGQYSGGAGQYSGGAGQYSGGGGTMSGGYQGR